jgi:hypothetical protein
LLISYQRICSNFFSQFFQRTGCAAAHQLLQLFNGWPGAVAFVLSAPVLEFLQLNPQRFAFKLNASVSTKAINFLPNLQT